MPSLRAGRPKDEGHEATDEDRSEDKIRLPSLFDPNEKDDTTYGVLDDFFDNFDGGTSKTQEDNAALMADEKNEETFNTKKWLGDSGASSHICKDSNYMNNVKTTQEKVTIGDSTTATANGRGMACLATSEGKDLNLEDCLYSRDSTGILFP